VGHSTGGDGEIVCYVAQRGKEQVAKAVLIECLSPPMLKTPANPEGLPIEVFDNLRNGLTKDRSQSYMDLAVLFYGANRKARKSLQGHAGSILSVEYASRLQECLRQHQGLL